MDPELLKKPDLVLQYVRAIEAENQSRDRERARLYEEVDRLVAELNSRAKPTRQIWLQQQFTQEIIERYEGQITHMREEYRQFVAIQQTIIIDARDEAVHQFQQQILNDSESQIVRQLRQTLVARYQEELNRLRAAEATWNQRELQLESIRLERDQLLLQVRQRTSSQSELSRYQSECTSLKETNGQLLMRLQQLSTQDSATVTNLRSELEMMQHENSQLRISIQKMSQESAYYQQELNEAHHRIQSMNRSSSVMMNYESHLEQARKELLDERHSKNELQTQLRMFESQISRLKQQISVQSTQYERTKAQIRKLNAEIEKRDLILSTMQSQTEIKSQQLALEADRQYKLTLQELDQLKDSSERQRNQWRRKEEQYEERIHRMEREFQSFRVNSSRQMQQLNVALNDKKHEDSERSSLRAQLTTMQQECGSYRAEISVLRQECSVYKSQLTTLQHDVGSYKSQLAAREQEAQTYSIQLQSLTERVNAYKSQFQLTQQELSNVKHQANATKQSSTDLQKNLKNAELERANFEARVLSLQSECGNLKTQLNSLQQERETSRGQLSASQQQMLILQHQIAAARQELSSLQLERNSFKNQLINIQQEYTSYRSQTTASLQQQSSNLQHDLMLLQQESQSYKTKLGDAQRQYTSADQDRASLRNQLITSQNDISSLHRQVAVLKSQLSAAKTDLQMAEQERNTFRANFVSAQNQHHTAQREMSKIEQEIMMFKSEINNLRSELALSKQELVQYRNHQASKDKEFVNYQLQSQSFQKEVISLKQQLEAQVRNKGQFTKLQIEISELKRVNLQVTSKTVQLEQTNQRLTREVQQHQRELEESSRKLHEAEMRFKSTVQQKESQRVQSQFSVESEITTVRRNYEEQLMQWSQKYNQAFYNWQNHEKDLKNELTDLANRCSVLEDENRKLQNFGIRSNELAFVEVETRANGLAQECNQLRNEVYSLSGQREALLRELESLRRTNAALSSQPKTITQTHDHQNCPAHHSLQRLTNDYMLKCQQLEEHIRGSISLVTHNLIIEDLERKIAMERERGTVAASNLQVDDKLKMPYGMNYQTMNSRGMFSLADGQVLIQDMRANSGIGMQTVCPNHEIRDLRHQIDQLKQAQFSSGFGNNGSVYCPYHSSHNHGGKKCSLPDPSICKTHGTVRSASKATAALNRTGSVKQVRQDGRWQKPFEQTMPQLEDYYNEGGASQVNSRKKLNQVAKQQNLNEKLYETSSNKFDNNQVELNGSFSQAAQEKGNKIEERIQSQSHLERFNLNRQEKQQTYQTIEEKINSLRQENAKLYQNLRK